jgi:hypothetical protein
MHVDTGSGVTWVMCKGRGTITSVVSVPSYCNSATFSYLCKKMAVKNCHQWHFVTTMPLHYSQSMMDLGGS